MPVLPPSPKASWSPAPARVAIVLDASYSMNYEMDRRQSLGHLQGRAAAVSKASSPATALRVSRRRTARSVIEKPPPTTPRVGDPGPSGPARQLQARRRDRPGSPGADQQEADAASRSLRADRGALPWPDSATNPSRRRRPAKQQTPRSPANSATRSRSSRCWPARSSPTTPVPPM
jgi:hypothetical protein